MRLTQSMAEMTQVIPTDHTEQLLKAISSFVKSSNHLKETQFTKGMVSSLCVKARVGDKLVSQFLNDIEEMKLEIGMYRAQVKSLEKQLAVAQDRYDESTFVSSVDKKKRPWTPKGTHESPSQPSASYGGLITVGDLEHKSEEKTQNSESKAGSLGLRISPC